MGIDFSDGLNIRPFTQQIMMDPQADLACNDQGHLQETVEGMRDDPFRRVLDGHDPVNDSPGFDCAKDGID